MFHTVRQLHRDFVRNGSDVLQTFTFYSSDEQLQRVASAVYNNVLSGPNNNNINMKTLVNIVVVVCLLLVVCCLLFVVCCLLLVVCYNLLLFWR